MATESCAEKSTGESVRGRAAECRANLSLRKEKEREGRGEGGKEGGREEMRITWRDERPHWPYVVKHPKCFSACLYTVCMTIFR